MKRIFVSLMGILLVTSAFAGGKNNVSKYNNLWGGGSLSSCGSHALVGSEACIGESQSQNCETKRMYARNHTDEYAIQMMVAMKVNDHGAMFCPVQLDARNKNKKNAWTEYSLLGDNSRCVWLCLQGYTGQECEKSSTDTASLSCNAIPFKRTDYSDLKRLASGANVEDNVAMFVWNKYYGCGRHKGQEHDIILVIKRWAPSGHGAWVQQVVFRSEREGWKKMVSWPVVYPATNALEKLVCKNGYQPNAGLTDCVPIDNNKCAEAQMCAGWSGFDETIHKFIASPHGSNCTEFRCKEDGTAFPGIGDVTCAPCETSRRGGISPVDGVCIKCQAGTVFNTNAANTGYCGSAIGYTKTDLQYGKGQTKNTVVEVENQCWTKTETSEYKACVEGAK